MESLVSAGTQSWLSWFLRGLLILGFLILGGRLIDLQIIKGDYYRGLSEGNRIRRVPITGARGKILSNSGEEIAGGLLSVKEIVFDNEEGFTKTLSNKDSGAKGTITEWIREYKLGESAGHLTGYVGEVDENEYGRTDPNCLEKGARRLGSFTGRGGLEEQYDCELRPLDGEQLIEVDNSGKLVRVLGKVDPTDGSDIVTNIDIGLQRVVAESFDRDRGAVVVTSAKGEVLAFYSAPSFDPNVFVSGGSGNIQRLFSDHDLPLFNRLISGVFHPGSVYKMVVAIAGLEEEVIDSDFIYDDPGQVEIGGTTYANWYFTQYGKIEGKIDLARGLARSTDTFFYKLGELLGIENIVKWSKEFGLGEKTGIDVPGEIAGLVPSPVWKKRNIGERWYLGNTINMSIGQGDLVLTPISVNMMTAALASGEVCQPKIVGEGDCRKLKVSKENLAYVVDGMKQACEKGGTAFPFFSAKPAVACKTGTAETSRESKTHAWFTMFAPVEDPEIVVTVLVEEGGEGSYDAAPIAKDIYDYWFER